MKQSEIKVGEVYKGRYLSFRKIRVLETGLPRLTKNDTVRNDGLRCEVLESDNEPDSFTPGDIILLTKDYIDSTWEEYINPAWRNMPLEEEEYIPALDQIFGSNE